MKKLFILILGLGSILFAGNDSRYDSGLNLPFNFKSGEVNPQTGNVTITSTDITLPGRGGFDFSLSRAWNLNSSNVFSMDLNPLTGQNRLSSSTIEAHSRLGVGWTSSIPYISKDIGPTGEVLHLLFNGSAYQIKLGTINSYNPMESNILGYDLLDKRIYGGIEGSKISYRDFTEFPLPEGFKESSERSKYVLILKNNSKYYFNSNGSLMMNQDSTGNNRIWYFYNSDGLLNLVVDSVGREINFTYSPNGNLINIYYVIEIWQKDDKGKRFQSTEKREVSYSYSSCENFNEVSTLKPIVSNYREPYLLKAVTNQIGEKVEYSYNLGKAEFSFNGKYNQSNIYLLLTSILNNTEVESKEKKYSSGKYYEYKLPSSGIYKKFFYSGYMEHYKVSRSYLKSIDGRVVNDTIYSYFKDGENGNFNQYSTRVQRGGLVSHYYYSLEDAPNLLNVLTSLKKESSDGFIEETFFTYDNNKTKTIDQVFRGVLIYKEKYNYDKKGNLTEHTDRGGLVVKNVYDPVYSIPVKEYKIVTFSHNGKSETKTYTKEWLLDKFGRIKSMAILEDITLRPIIIKTYTYDSFGNIIQETDPYGYSTYVEYDKETNSLPIYSWSRIIVDSYNNWITTPKDEDRREIPLFKRAIYNSDGSLYMEFDSMGNGTEHFYDKLGRNIETIYPDLNDETQWYKNLPELGFTLGSSPQFIEYLHSRADNPGFRITISDKTASITKEIDLDKDSGTYVYSGIDYDGLGNPIKEYTSQGVTTKTYDNQGRLVAITDPDSSEAYTNIVINGQTVKKYDKTWIVKYDDLSREIKVLYPSNSSSTDVKYIEYDDTQNSVTTIDPEGRVTYSRSDWSGNLLETILYGYKDLEEDQRIFKFEYDTLNRKRIFIDPLNISTLYNYNERDQLIEQSYGETGSDMFIYDDGGLLVEKIDRKKNKIINEYNELGLPVKISRFYMVDGEPQLEEETRLSYNSLGLLKRVEGNDLVELTSYNPRGEVISLSRYIKNKELRVELKSILPLKDNSHTFNYSYMDNGSLKSMRYPDKTITEYNYQNRSGYLTSINENSNPFLYNIKYNRSGVVNSMSWDNNITQSWLFDNRKRIKEIDISINDSPIETLSYTLNSLGDIEKINDNKYIYNGYGEITSSKILIPGNIEFLSSVENNFGLFNTVDGDINRDNRVNGSDHHLAFLNDIQIGTFDKELFTYDKSGNRLSLKQNDDFFTYKYGQRNRLLEVKKNGVKFITYEYDTNGNTTKVTNYNENEPSIREYTYDTLNRVVSISNKNKITEYFYDNSNNRFAKISSGKKTIYYRHGLAVAMDIILPGYKSEVEINKYLLSGDLIAGRINTSIKSSGEPVIKKSFYHLDHLNSTKFITNQNGEVEVRYEYRAFGEQLKRTDSKEEDVEDLGKYSYGGKELDRESNLYYFNQRYYDAAIGRFINVDPIQDGNNWYVYCSNNPLNMIDPTGLSYITDLRATEAFVEKRTEYINKYQNKGLKDGTVINETGVSSGNTAEHKLRTIGKALKNLFVSDYTAPVGTPVYTGRENSFKTDALRWSYGDSSDKFNDEGDVIAIGQGFGRRVVSTIDVEGDKQQLVYAHFNHNAQVDSDFSDLQHSALTAKRDSFSLPGKVQIGEVGMTGTTTGPHLHYERNQVED